MRIFFRFIMILVVLAMSTAILSCNNAALEDEDKDEDKDEVYHAISKGNIEDSLEDYNKKILENNSDNSEV